MRPCSGRSPLGRAPPTCPWLAAVEIPCRTGLVDGKWAPGVARPPRIAGPATYHDDMPAGVRRPTAAFFDLDKTIIAKSSSLAFSKPFQAGGLISRRRDAAVGVRAVRLPRRRRRPRPDGEDAAVHVAADRGLGRRHRPRDRRRDAAPRRRPDRLRRGGLAHRGAPGPGPRRGHRLHQRRRGGRPDRRDARRRRRDRHPARDRRRQVHRRRSSTTRTPRRRPAPSARSPTSAATTSRGASPTATR